MVNSSDALDPAPLSPTRGTPKPISFQIGTGGGRPQPTLDRPGLPVGLSPQSTAMPKLPKPKRPVFSRHRHDANPALALKVLEDIQVAIAGWHGELRQILEQIQALYLEGPIVEGWLEALATAPAACRDTASLLRHGDPEAISDYVDRLSQGSEVPPSHPAPSAYQLCSLDADGQVQCLPCPAEQLSTLSQAIARHQRLRQLLDQKHYLEAKLQRSVEVLSHSRDSLDIQPL
ncbi:MAG: hypothetical protein VKL98_10130 [Cyanobacteriota bacterium]|nr:hypothetical protein [Cyanobacteriota bacterium]